MSSCTAITTIILLFLHVIITTSSTPPTPVEEARAAVSRARDWARSLIITPHGGYNYDNGNTIEALKLCDRLYEGSESRLSRLAVYGGVNLNNSVDFYDDARTWLSGSLANHRACLDGLKEVGFDNVDLGVWNLSVVVGHVLSLNSNPIDVPHQPRPNRGGGLLAKWNAATSKADFVVAQDGSGSHRSINQALATLKKLGRNRPGRVIIHVKSGIYREQVIIEHHMNNLMFVGDGTGRTIITGDKNVPDGASTAGSATFGVYGDGFWARDITFENTAGPHKHQAVALTMASDLAVIYRCSIIAYQDTLFTLSLRQFYRDCRIYGTIDFIFGDAAAVIQNCEIFIRKPMDHQANMITAQGRDHPDSNTGISIIGCRIRPGPDFIKVSNLYKSYLGRPWKKYSRTVVMKSDLDGLIHPRGWTEWKGEFALSTLYYAEYLNSGRGASTVGRVKWAGFHVLYKAQEASAFSVSGFIRGEFWIPETGVPFDGSV